LALTRRGKWAVAAGGVVVAAGATLGILKLTGAGKHIPLVKDIVGGDEKPAKCINGAVPDGGAPDRPALAIKVENLPEARPQAGLDKADIVYEEPVEGGITRFIAVFECLDASRVGPVRSARLTDPPILIQFGKQTLFGYAGGVPRVERDVATTGLHDVNYEIPPAVSAYIRDPRRDAPHNLYTSTKALYKAGHDSGGRPKPIFRFGPEIFGKARAVHTAHVDFSSTADVFWRWNPKKEMYFRFHGTEPHMLEGNVQVSAANVIVQVVHLKDTGIVDVAGNPSPEVESVGSGKCYVLRGGRMIVGTWVRKSENQVTQFLDPSRHPIQLHPGRTWVELFPNTRPFEAH